MLISAEVFGGSGLPSLCSTDSSVKWRGAGVPLVHIQLPLPSTTAHWPRDAVLQGSSSAEPLPPQHPHLEHTGLQVLDAVTKAGYGLSGPASWQNRVKTV